MKVVQAMAAAAAMWLAPYAGADDPQAPPVVIRLAARQGHAAPARQGFTHTGGGNIDVQQPTPDVAIITLTGVAVAGAHPGRPSAATLTFDVEQGFEVVFERPGVTKARLTLEGRVVGLLRSHERGGGSAGEGPGHAMVIAGPVAVATVATDPHCVSGGRNLSVNCRPAPMSAVVGPGPLTLKQTWSVTASHPACLWPCKAASAELAPDPALDPLWISAWEPFRGAQKKDFGFQVQLRVAPESAGPEPERR